MVKQIRIWHTRANYARGEELKEFEDMVNLDLRTLGDQVEKVYSIGVGIEMVVTAVLRIETGEENRCR